MIEPSKMFEITGKKHFFRMQRRPGPRISSGFALSFDGVTVTFVNGEFTRVIFNDAQPSQWSGMNVPLPPGAKEIGYASAR